MQAVLWDMDGTLVDTEPYWIATEYELVEAHGGTWSHEHAMNLVGNELLESARYIRKHGGVDLEPEAIVDYLLDGVIRRVQQEIPWRPGARELLAALNEAAIPCVLVTMSYLRLVEPVMAEIDGVGFTALVTGDAVEHGKPHPEPYLKGAALLGLEPSQCLAIEDSNTGVASALAAGTGVLVVPHHVAVPEAPGQVRAQTLAGITVEQLRVARETSILRGPATTLPNAD